MRRARPPRLAGLVLAGLVLAGLVGGVALLPGVVAQGPTPDNGTAENGTGVNATFNRSTVSEERGDIAEIGLELSNTTDATVTVGSEAVNYETNVTVNDSDGDGRVTLRMNTYVAGTGDGAAYDTAADGDVIRDVNRTTGALNSPLETSTYNLSVAVAGNRTDTATLELVERTRGELVTWTAPAASFDNATNRSEVAAAIANGRITATDTVAVGDVSVNQFKLSGIYGPLAATNFTRLVERGALDFGLVQTNPGPNRPPKRLALEQSLANGSIRVVPDERNDVLYVNVDTGAATFRNGTPAAGDEFESTLTVRGGSVVSADNGSIAANVTFVGAELGLGDVVLAADGNQTVTGTTSVAPGSEVTVRLQNNDTASFVKTNTTTVTPNGSFAAAFNLSDIPPGTMVGVRADGPLSTSDTANVTVIEDAEKQVVGGDAEIEFADQRTTGETVTVRNVTLPDSGFVAVHAPNVSSAPVESVLGSSSYLENGTSEDVEVPLDEPLNEGMELVVMAHTDSNDNEAYDFSSSNGTEDGPYIGNENPVTASARVTVDAATTTAGLNATAGTGTATAEDGPGFGLVAALVVLSLAGLAARRAHRR